jgi:hypothetical protein
MRKIRILFVSIAVVTAVGGAFASKEKAPCEYMTQYFNNNGSYTMAGTYGLDYFCVGAVGVCTWYKPWPGSDWTPCKAGYYLPIEEFNNLKK